MGQNKLSKGDFRSDLIEQVDRNLDDLYQAYLKAEDAVTAGTVADPFAQSNEPLKTPEFQPANSGESDEAVQAQIAELEAQSGAERLLLSVGGVIVKLTLAGVI